MNSANLPFANGTASSITTQKPSPMAPRNACTGPRAEAFHFGNGPLGLASINDDLDRGPHRNTITFPVTRNAKYGYKGWVMIEVRQNPEVRNLFRYQLLWMNALPAMARRTSLDKNPAKE
jgi:hypothetical protein